METREDIGQEELQERLEALLVGQRIVGATASTLTLGNGTVLEVEGSTDCCAWGDADFEDFVNTETAVTAVTAVDHTYDSGYRGTIRLFVLTGAGPVLTVNQAWDGTSGYYFCGVYLTVKTPEGAAE